jgi:AcrR family transcriptional regulator
MARVDRRPRKRLSPVQRRSAILTAARDAFAGATYDAVSLAGIAGAADASEALVHRYFATKGELYVEIVRSSIDTLLDRQRAADDAVGGPDADRWQRVVATIEVYLDFVSDPAQGWAAPLRRSHGSFQAAALARTEATTHYVELLREVLGVDAGEPRDQAIYGYVGFLDAACLSWVEAGADAGQRAAMITMALGALSGALAALDSLAD